MNLNSRISAKKGSAMDKEEPVQPSDECSLVGMDWSGWHGPRPMAEYEAEQRFYRRVRLAVLTLVIAAWIAGRLF